MKMLKYVFMLLPVLFLLACTELLILEETVDDNLSGNTKGYAPEYYYWYHGKKEPIQLNQDYVNILLDTTAIKRHEVSALCAELGVEAKEDPDANGLFKVVFKYPGDYDDQVEILRQDKRIRYVLPFFEFMKGAEPVGTSHHFSVQIKELLPENLEAGAVIPYLEKEFDVETLLEEADKQGVRIIGAVPYMPDWYELSIEGSDFENAIDAANCFYESGKFEAIDPNFRVTVVTDSTNDPMYSQQWGLENATNDDYDIDVEGAWEITTGTGVKVAVVDFMVDPSHSDLSTNLYASSYDASTGMPCTDLSGSQHGAHVAGIVGAVGNNNLQIVGVAYGSKIMRVSTSGASASQIASGICWAWQNGADVINCSWHLDASSQEVESAIIYAMNYGRSGKGTIVVFSAGNTGNTGNTALNYPACFNDDILTVGAMNSDGNRSQASSYGTGLDVVAPGESILSLLPFNGVGIRSGTSMAAPHVSGVAALMLAANPDLTREEAVQFIIQTAKKISPDDAYTYFLYQNNLNATWNSEVGYGLVDATMAVNVAHYAETNPPSGTHGMGLYVPQQGITGSESHYETISYSNGVFLPIYLYQIPVLTNGAYKYYWTYSVSGNWTPAISFVQDGAIVNFTSVPSAITLNLRCQVYNGHTLLGVSECALTIQP